MLRDVALLDLCATGELTGAIRVYSFSPPCLSLGRLQRESGIDMAACERDGVDVVRRPSGGRAVLHQKEVTYAVVCRASDPDLGGRVLEACARIHRAIAAGLAGIGVPTREWAISRDERVAARRRAAAADCFAEPSAHELLDGLGHKLVGSAQARRGGALLQHGSILLEPHRGSAYVLGPATRTPSGSVCGSLGRPVSREELADAIVCGFALVLGARLSPASAQPATA